MELDAKPQTKPQGVPSLKQKEKEKEEHPELDKKRVLIGLIVAAIVLGGFVSWAKSNPPKVADIQSKKAPVSTPGAVAGVSDSKFDFADKQDDVKEHIDEIKTNITNLKPEDIAKQGPVQKILNDLDAVIKQATESMNVQKNVCEEVKKRFCE